MSSTIAGIVGAGTPLAPTKIAPLRYTLEVVTPMFLAGADQHQIRGEGLRGSSLKASLRWWWRATTTESLTTDLRIAEADLFGDTDRGRGLQVQATCHAATWSISEKPLASGSLGYLLGQGLFHFRDGVTRPAIQPGSRFDIRLTPKTGSEDRFPIVIEAFNLFGSLGARSRRGFGSTSIVNDPLQPHDLADYKRRISSFLSKFTSADTLKSWSHLGKGSRCEVVGQDFATWEEAHRKVGDILLAYRQSLGGMKAPYGKDHDLISDYLHRNLKLAHAPARAAFGIPHNYFFKSSKKKLEFHWEDNDRRASPLLIHIARLGSGRFAATALLMDGIFLPKGKQLVTKQTKERVAAPSYDAIHQFLDRIAKA